MSDKLLTTNDPASEPADAEIDEPADAEIEKRAIQLARADGLAWAAPLAPEQGEHDQSGVASNDDRERYRALANERLEAERGLVIP